MHKSSSPPVCASSKDAAAESALLVEWILNELEVRGTARHESGTSVFARRRHGRVISFGVVSAAGHTYVLATAKEAAEFAVSITAPLRRTGT